MSIGLYPGVSITGMTAEQVEGGSMYVGVVPVPVAKADLDTDFNILAGLPCQFLMATAGLGGLTLSPGVHCFSSASVNIATDMVLDGNNNLDSIFIIQIG